MSVVVRMKMPKDGCHTCDARCVSDLYGYICGIERKNVMPFLGKKNRPDWCPVICSLPEGHGRLVDADAMAEDLDFDVENDQILHDLNRVGNVLFVVGVPISTVFLILWFLTSWLPTLWMSDIFAGLVIIGLYMKILSMSVWI